jgi:hypothetical protein
MRTHFLKCFGAFVLCLGLLGTSPVRAVPLYDNLGASPVSADPACTSGGDCYGPLANSFSTGSSNVYLTQVTLALYLVGDPQSYSGAFTISVLNNIAGSPPTPGSSLFSSGSIPISDLSGSGVTFYTLPVSAPVLLTANTRFWIGLTDDASDPSGSVAWALSPDINHTGVPGEFVYLLGSSRQNADSVDGAPYLMQVEATPLPSTLLLFAGGLGVFGLVTRGRKRKGALSR